MAADLNGDSKLDLATANYGNGTVSVLVNNGSGVFAAGVAYPALSGTTFGLYDIVAGDFNGDGKVDLAVANYNYGVTGVYLGNGDGTLQTGQKYSVSAIALVGGDFNSDGITDLATASYSNANVTLLFGNPAKPLPVDATTGLESGFGRGNLTSTSDVDYFSWTGKAGDVVQAASENPGNPGSSGLTYQIENASGSVLTTLSSNSNDEGQSSPVTLPYSGTYLVEVSYDYGYSGEYRFRVTEAPPTVQLATSFNDSSVSSSNTPTLTNSSPGNLTATVAAYIGQGDPNGEFYNLGNVVAGTKFNLTLSQPASSTLGGVLNIFNSAGTNLTNNTAAGNTLSYTVPPGAGGSYYARVSSASVMTVSFWMDWNGTNGECPISFLGYPLYLDNGSFGFDSNGDVYGISSASLVNSWHFVTAVFVDGSYVNDQLWIDGVKQTLTQRQGSPASVVPPVATAATIGDYINGSSYFTGTLDEVAYFDTQLSATQIAAEYAARNSGSYSTTILGQSPVAYYRLGESSGNVAYDSSGYFNNGTFGSGITLGAAGALGNDSNTAYQFSSGQISVTVPESTGLLGQYELSIDVANTTSPQITGDTLPVQGTTSNAVIDRFTLTFSENMNAATVNNTANYTLQGGSDGHVYQLSSPAYTSGLTATYLVSDGPLQPGSYTLTVSSGLTDGTANPLVAYSLNFTMAGVAPYTLENRSNNTPATATPLVTPTSQPDGSFTAGSSIGVGSEPYGIASGHFTSDGHLDLAVANYNSSSISILLGNGNGTFAIGTTLTDPNLSNAIAVATGDLNGDGKTDLVVSSFGNGKILVFMGNGDGTFAAPTAYFAVGTSTSSEPRGLAIADLNNDGKMDVVVADTNNNSISVLLGTGGGALASAVTYSTGASSSPQAVAVADFNGDTKLDVATANYNNSTVSILQGTGSGTFGAHTDYAANGTNPNWIVAADLNGDSKLDLATANYGNGTVSGVGQQRQRCVRGRGCLSGTRQYLRPLRHRGRRFQRRRQGGFGGGQLQLRRHRRLFG